MTRHVSLADARFLCFHKLSIRNLFTWMQVAQKEPLKAGAVSGLSRAVMPRETKDARTERS
jgi:hypothetical protein